MHSLQGWEQPTETVRPGLPAYLVGKFAALPPSLGLGALRHQNPGVVGLRA